MATGSRSLKERQREEREQLILQAAEELLLERGYYETSIDEIAARVGISKGTVYLHFDSKEDLIVALFERGLQKFLRAMEQMLSSEASPRARLHAIIAFVYGNMANQRMQALGAIAQSAELRSVLAQKRHHMMEHWEEPARRISAVLEEGKASGEFDPTIPTPVMLTIFTGLLVPFGYQRLIAREQLTPDEAIAHLSEFFFRGVAPRTPHENQSGKGDVEG